MKEATQPMYVLERRSAYMSFWWLVTLALLFIHYGRPQDVITPLAAFKPFALTSLALFGLLFLSGKPILQLQHQQMRIIWMLFILFALLLPFSHKSAAIGQIKNLLMFMPFMLSVTALVNTPRRLRQLMTAVVVIALYIAIRGAMLHDGAYKNAMFNLGNFLGDPNDFSLYMDMMLPISVGMMMYEKSWRRRIFFGVASCMFLYLIITSFSRGGFLGLLVTVAVMLYYAPHKKVTFSVAGVALAIVLVFAGSDWKETATSSFDSTQSTALTRLTTWYASWSLFLHQPYGVGVQTVPAKMYKHVPPTINGQATRNPLRFHGDVNHSVWLTALTEWGVVGFGLFIWLLVVNINHCRLMARAKPIDDEARFLRLFGVMCLASLAAYLSAGTFLTVNYYPHLWYLSAFIAAGYRVTYEKARMIG